MNIDSILTEWRYRLPAGYPKTAQDFGILRDVILEMTDVDLSEAEHIVRRAMGLEEAPEPDADITDSNTDFIDAAGFEKFILQRYTVDPQQIIGLPAMYTVLMQNSEYDTSRTELLELIKNPKVLSLKTGIIPIRGIYLELYDLIKATIKIPNGDFSELWFAIAFDGRVKGAVSGEEGIEADIVIGGDNGETVSLKNYEKTTFDFGSLPAEATQLLNEFLEMSKLLTGQDINKSKGATDINNVLKFLDNESVEAQIRRLIEMSETTDIILIRNVGERLKKFYTLTDNLDTMISAFCHIVDEMLYTKVKSVKWWGMIIKGNKTLFLESADDIYDAVRCKNDRLSSAIANFHQNKLFVLGSQLSTKVTKKSQD